MSSEQKDSQSLGHIGKDARLPLASCFPLTKAQICLLSARISFKLAVKDCSSLTKEAKVVGIEGAFVDSTRSWEALSADLETLLSVLLLAWGNFPRFVK